MKRLVAVTALAIVALAAPVAASAHNAGHLWRPDGTCQEVGSFRDAPLVGRDRTQLDLVSATPFDEYGVSFVGYHGNTPIYPGPCPR